MAAAEVVAEEAGNFLPSAPQHKATAKLYLYVAFGAFAIFLLRYSLQRTKYALFRCSKKYRNYTQMQNAGSRLAQN